MVLGINRAISPQLVVSMLFISRVFVGLIGWSGLYINYGAILIDGKISTPRLEWKTRF